MKNIRIAIWSFIFTITASSFSAAAADTDRTHELYKSFQYISPVPGSQLVSKQTNIIIRPGGILDVDLDQLIGLTEISGSASASHSFQVIMSDDRQTIILKPDHIFNPGEKVTVTLRMRLKTIDGRLTDPGAFSFTISPWTENLQYEQTCEEISAEPSEIYGSDSNSLSDIKFSAERDVSLPSDFPGRIISVMDNPDDGYVFIAKHRPLGRTYLMILDNSGHPIFYRRMPNVVTDFKKQSNNLLSYFMYNDNHFSILDSTYTKIDFYECGNGYTADHHDFQLIGNGHAFLIAYDHQIVDMSIIVPGGDPNCRVTGLIVQELDSLRNVVFQWRSWDHFEITDATHVDFTSSRIDYVHGNAVELDYDGNILISSRHMDEITKINRQTGEIIWRLGGINNEFTFVGDSISFNRQHDIRRIANGNITLFDNGNWHTPQFSRAVEYELDEDNKICTLAWEFRNNPDLHCAVNGSVQRLPNGNTMIGWGGPSDITLTEVAPDSTKEFELSYEGAPSTWSYRSFRFPWRGIAAAPYLIAESAQNHIHLVFNKFGDTSVVKYYIYGGLTHDPETIIDSTSNTYKDIYNLMGGLQYYFRVAAIDNQGNESPFSNEDSATMPAAEVLLYLPGDANMHGGFWPPQVVGADVTYLVNYLRGLADPCRLEGFYYSGDITGDCYVIGSDVTKLVAYFRGLAGIGYCPDYEPAWPTPGDLPEGPPDGWPHCE